LDPLAGGSGTHDAWVNPADQKSNYRQPKPGVSVGALQRAGLVVDRPATHDPAAASPTRIAERMSRARSARLGREIRREADLLETNARGLVPRSKGVAGPLEGTSGPRLSRRGFVVPPAAPRREMEDDAYLTTSEAFHGLSRRPDTADVYRQMVSATVPRQRESLTFHSLWGDSLKKGDLSLWKETALKTAYEVACKEALPDWTPHDDGISRDGRSTFLRWMRDQGKYVSGLMPPARAAAVKQWLKKQSEEEQELFLAAARQLAATAGPHRAPFSSETHARHGPTCMYGDPAVTAIERRETMYKTYGRPRPVEIKGLRKAGQMGTGSSAAAAAAAAGPPRPAALADSAAANFKSQFTTAWPGGDARKKESAYERTIGVTRGPAHYRNPQAAVKTVDPYRQPTAAFGPLNTDAFPQCRLPAGASFVVPAYFCRRRGDNPTKATKGRTETTHERGFQPPSALDDGAVARGRVRQREAAALLKKSTLPLGSERQLNALDTFAKGSRYTADFGGAADREMDTEWRRERGEALRAFVFAPTASGLRLAPTSPETRRREAA